MPIKLRFKKWFLYLGSVAFITCVFFACKQILPFDFLYRGDLFTRGMVQVTNSGEFLHALSAFPILGFDVQYTDLFFFYHHAASLLYVLAGWNSVEWGTSLALLSAGIGMYFWLRRYAGSFVTTLLVVLFLFIQQSYFSRLLALQPAILSILFFALLLWANIRRNILTTFAGTCLFVFSSVHIYIPLFFLPLHYWYYRQGHRQSKSCAYAIFLGVGVAVFVNPYFPVNLYESYLFLQQQASVIFFQTFEFPVWGYPTFSKSMLLGNLLHFAALIYASFVFYRKCNQRKDRLPEFGFLLGLAFVLLFLSFRFYRLLDFFALVCLVVSALAFSWSKLARMEKFGLFGFFIAIVLVQNSAYSLENGRMLYFERVKQLVAGLALKPSSQVFHCDPGTGEALFALNKPVKLIDFADNSQLRKANPHFYKMQKLWQAGFIPEPYNFMRKQNNASYSICAKAEVNEKLSRDPSFTLVAAESGPWNFDSLQVYERIDDWDASYLRRFRVSDLSVQRLFWRNKSEGELKKWEFSEQMGHLRVEQDSFSDKSCRLIKLPEGFRSLGAKYLAIGGGPEFYIWHKQQPFYRARFYKNNVMQDIVPLPKEFSNWQDLEFIVCSVPTNLFYSFSLAILKKSERDTLCQNLHARCF